MFSKLIMAKNARKQHKYADCPDLSMACKAEVACL